jgi:hypothetical protein
MADKIVSQLLGPESYTGQMAGVECERHRQANAE